MNSESQITKEEAIKIAYDYITANNDFSIKNPSAWYCAISKTLPERLDGLKGKWIVGFDIDMGPTVLASTAACHVTVDPVSHAVVSL